MRLHRFNEAKSVSSAPNEVLKPFGLTTKDLDRLLDVLEKNALDADLLQDLKKFSNAGYRNLRAWNVKILKKGIDRVQGKLDEIDLVEDYLIDLIGCCESYQEVRIYLLRSKEISQRSF